MTLRKNRDFHRLWTAQTISKFGSHVGHAGVEFTALLALRATPAQMGLLGAFAATPVLLVGLLAGVWVDRTRRRPLLIAADLGRAALLLSVPLALFLGVLRIEQLYLVAALAGALTVLYGVADQSALPALVRREDLVEANSRLGMSDSMAEVGGPALGGTLVQWLTAPVAILLNAGSFLLSAFILRGIRAPEAPPAPAGGRRRLGIEIREGIRIVWREPTLRALALSAAGGNFFGSFYGVLYSLYLLRALGFTPALVGISIGVGGLGALLGAMLAGPLTRRVGVGPALIGCRILSAVIGFLIPLAGGPLPLAAAMVLAAQWIGDIPGAIASINETSLRQAVIPHHLLGRASASMEVLARSVLPLGALAGGLLGEVIGPRPTLYMASAGILLSGMWLLVSPLPRTRGLPPQA